MTTRSKLLAHYADKDPTRFVQLDGWTDADEIMGRDADGHGITGLMTTELMDGPWDVRVLVPRDADPATTAALLRKVIDWIERGAIEDIRGPELPIVKGGHKDTPPAVLAGHDDLPF